MWLIDRLKEPSTWAGIGAILGVLSQTVVAISHNLTTAGVVAAVASGAVAVVSAEGK